MFLIKVVRELTRYEHSPPGGNVTKLINEPTEISSEDKISKLVCVFGPSACKHNIEKRSAGPQQLFSSGLIQPFLLHASTLFQFYRCCHSWALLYNRLLLSFLLVCDWTFPLPRLLLTAISGHVGKQFLTMNRRKIELHTVIIGTAYF